jgi:TolA-binding protein
MAYQTIKKVAKTKVGKTIIGGTLAAAIFVGGTAAGASGVITLPGLTDRVMDMVHPVSTGINNNVDSATTSLLQIEDIISDKDATITSVVEEANRRITTKNSTISALRTQKTDLETQVANLQTQLDEALADTTDPEEIAALEEQITLLEGKLSEISGKTYNLKQNIKVDFGEYDNPADTSDLIQ